MHDHLPFIWLDLPLGRVDGRVKKVRNGVVEMVACLFSESRGGGYLGQWKRKVSNAGHFDLLIYSWVISGPVECSDNHF